MTLQIILTGNDPLPAFRARKFALETAAEAFPHFAAEGATVISF